MKKLTSFILSIVLILLSMPISISAVDEDIDRSIDMSKYTNEELDLTQYTMDDLMNMSSDEYMNLVAEFERVYDPFDSYETSNLSETITTPTTITIEDNNLVSPTWTSGNYNKITKEYNESGCHEYITSVGSSILISDKGYFGASASESVGIALMISLSSLLPDRDEVGVMLYAGHFYDPDTGENYAGDTTNTAKTNAQAHYKSALVYAKNGDMVSAYEYLGRCLHYIQDANEPHHAANVISNGFNSHAKFETYAWENAETLLDGYDSISSDNYVTAVDSTVGKMTHKCALFAKSKIGSVNDADETKDWEATAKVCLKKSAKFTAMIMYRFGQSEYVPFYSN